MFLRSVKKKIDYRNLKDSNFDKYTTLKNK